MAGSISIVSATLLTGLPVKRKSTHCLKKKRRRRKSPNPRKARSLARRSLKTNPNHRKGTPYLEVRGEFLNFPATSFVSRLRLGLHSSRAYQTGRRAG